MLYFIYIFQKENTNERHFNETLTSNNVDILEYLPVDILKNVHCTLKSQPTSSKGKILFLKSFEKTLMTEIGKKKLDLMRDNFCT